MVRKKDIGGIVFENFGLDSFGSRKIKFPEIDFDKIDFKKLDPDVNNQKYPTYGIINGLPILELMFKYYRKSKAPHLAIIFNYTEKYFNENVLPILNYCQLTKEESNEILHSGFENFQISYEAIINDYDAEEDEELDYEFFQFKLFEAFSQSTKVALKMSVAMQSLKNEFSRENEEVVMNFREMHLFHLNTKKELLIAEYKLAQYELNRKSKETKKRMPGKPPKFQDQSHLDAILDNIKDWQFLNKTQLAQKLGYRTSSGLNEALKAGKLSLPSK
ncbi:MAG: hypothetical protein NTX65_14975 [Ignavibacteriales bacterium]|nr:hypothetical protein [Ignavibacteriales bacterium]